ncbi:hypothetical protein KOW79_015311 [Hemibagrus wyckioides]|uniref:Ras-GEF domain-containing protein n=1 Tax=Hemibagrus wyckioides TaxID=337641 RepID=A0A9D3NDT5_9TELE|nr:hypothetical protein KOW79_015311 [Hemibagrus wyckioides]
MNTKEAHQKVGVTHNAPLLGLPVQYKAGSNGKENMQKKSEFKRIPYAAPNTPISTEASSSEISFSGICGLILQDLTFVHLGNPDLIDGKVNFSKRWQQFNILDSMRRFQQVHYELKRNDDIVAFFNDFSDHLAEEALWELSLKIKPRNITRRRTERDEKT